MSLRLLPVAPSTSTRSLSVDRSVTNNSFPPSPRSPSWYTFSNNNQTPVPNCHCPMRRSSASDESLFFVYAIDKATTKLKIPSSAVEKTLALEDDGLVPGLCRLFLAGCCRQGSHCYQIHANPGVVANLRAAAYEQPSCCIVHGAPCRLQGFPLGLTVTIESKRKVPIHATTTSKMLDDEPCLETSCYSNGDTASLSAASDDKAVPATLVLSIHSFSPTSCLWKAYRSQGGASLFLPRGMICRQHRTGLCRFGDECSFLHVCRSVSLGPLPEPKEPKVPRSAPTTPHYRADRARPGGFSSSAPRRRSGLNDKASPSNRRGPQQSHFSTSDRLHRCSHFANAAPEAEEYRRPPNAGGSRPPANSSGASWKRGPLRAPLSGQSSNSLTDSQ